MQSTIAARWPNFRPKTSKDAGKKMVGRKNFMAEFCKKWPKRGRNFFGTFLTTEKRKMTQDTKKFAQHLDFLKKLLDKNYLLGSLSKQSNSFNWLFPSFQ